MKVCGVRGEEREPVGRRYACDYQVGRPGNSTRRPAPSWLITDCSTGLSRPFAEAALRRGHNVVATARDASNVQDLADAYPDTALAVALDVTGGGQEGETGRSGNCSILAKFFGRTL